jgi:anaerobic selenocysteine-containing dehydrogenase
MRRRDFIKVIAGSTTLAAFVLLVSLIVVAPRAAVALPSYAQKEHKPCEYCHVNPEGGSVRNGMGRQYEANGHTFKK